MKKSLYDQIQDALTSRSQWETRMQTFYQMRQGGMRRRNKPYSGAPDLHFPLGDSLIEKLKPSYIQQMYGGETIASFISLRTQDSDITSAAAYWFDYSLKQRSNFERTMFVAIDEMLQDGFTPIKVYWDVEQNCLAFDQIDPLYFIVPPSTQEINAGGGADWVVHVITVSEAEYRSNPRFNQDDDYIKSIKGKGDARESGSNAKLQTVELREGINYTNNDNEIILWEIYDRDRKKNKITIETISPVIAWDDERGPVREPFGLPYNKGVFADGETFPFFRVRAELKGKGHYSSRGIIEINANFEHSLCKSWNTMHEWQDFFSKPQFTSTQPIPNANNYKTKPGGILPPGLTPVEMPETPSSLREDMEFTRSLAEYRTQLPDLGSSQHLVDQGGGGKVTATQINAIVGQSGQGNDMRARVFRMDLAEGLNMAWALALQYSVANLDAQGQPDNKSLMYIVENEIKTLDASAMHDDYDITPNGSADSWNKGTQMQKRLAFYQTFSQNPYIAMDELTKWVMEGDDPRMVKRLFRDPGIQQQDQSEEQANEIALMLIGFPAPVHPTDDDKTHIGTLAQFVQDKLQKGEALTPEFARLWLQHIGAQGQQMEQKKDPQAKQIEAQVAPLIDLMTQIAQQGGNIIPMQGVDGNAPGTPAATAPGQSAPAPSQTNGQADKPSAILNALAALTKAGAPVTRDDISAALVAANLPPLPPIGSGGFPAAPHQALQPIPQPQPPSPPPQGMQQMGGS